MIEQNGQRYYNVKEVAANLSKHVSAVHQLIKYHKDKLSEYLIKYKDHDDYRPVMYLSEKGVAILLNVKNVNPNNQFSKQVTSSENELSYKEHVAKEAITKNEPTSVISKQVESDSLVLMARTLLENVTRAAENTRKIDEMDKRIGILEGDPSKMPITPSQRKHIHSRINGLHFYTGQHQKELYGRLHDLVGPRKIEDYSMQDYQLAIITLKKQYEGVGLNW